MESALASKGASLTLGDTHALCTVRWDVPLTKRTRRIQNGTYSVRTFRGLEGDLLKVTSRWTADGQR